jgi:MFS family permease
MLSQGVVIPLLPTIVAQTHSTLGNTVGVGVAVAAFGLARLLTNIPAAYVGGRIGRRPMLVIGPLVTAATMVGVATAPSLEYVIAWRALAGVSSAIFLTAALTYLGDNAPSSRSGSTFAYFYMSFSAGVAAGPAIGGVLAELQSVALPLLVVAATSVASAMLAALALPPGRVGRQPSSSPSGQRWRPWSDWRFLVVGMVTLIGFATRNGSQQTVVPVAALGEGVAVGIIGLGFSLSSIMSATGGPLTGFLLDRYPRGRVLAMAAGVAALVILGWTLQDWYPASFLVTMAVYGLTSSVLDGAAVTTANDLAPDEGRARAIGFYRLFGDGGYVLGPLLLGAIADGTGPSTAILVNTAFLLAAATLATLSLSGLRQSRSKVDEAAAVEAEI